MSKMQVSIRWNQNQLLSHDIARPSKSQGSLMRELLIRKGIQTGNSYHSERLLRTTDCPNSRSISYRLPKLPENITWSGRNHTSLCKESSRGVPICLKRFGYPRMLISAAAKVSNREREIGEASEDDEMVGHCKQCRLYYINSSPSLWKSKSQNEDFRAPEDKCFLRSIAEANVATRFQFDMNRKLQSAAAVHDSHYVPKNEDTVEVKFPLVQNIKIKDDKRLSWQLSPYENKNFDKQGLGPTQGPFSRELPKKCMPPINWLRMKLRHRINACSYN